MTVEEPVLSLTFSRHLARFGYVIVPLILCALSDLYLQVHVDSSHFPVRNFARVCFRAREICQVVRVTKSKPPSLGTIHFGIKGFVWSSKDSEAPLGPTKNGWYRDYKTSIVT